MIGSLEDAVSAAQEHRAGQHQLVLVVDLDRLLPSGWGRARLRPGAQWVLTLDQQVSVIQRVEYDGQQGRVEAGGSRDPSDRVGIGLRARQFLHQEQSGQTQHDLGLLAVLGEGGPVEGQGDHQGL